MRRAIGPTCARLSRFQSQKKSDPVRSWRGNCWWTGSRKQVQLCKKYYLGTIWIRRQRMALFTTEILETRCNILWILLNKILLGMCKRLLLKIFSVSHRSDWSTRKTSLPCYTWTDHRFACPCHFLEAGCFFALSISERTLRTRRKEFEIGEQYTDVDDNNFIQSLNELESVKSFYLKIGESVKSFYQAPYWSDEFIYREDACDSQCLWTL